MIIDRLTQGGIMDPGQLYEPPFTGMHYQGLDGLFPDQDAEGIVGVLRRLICERRRKPRPRSGYVDLCLIVFLFFRSYVF